MKRIVIALFGITCALPAWAAQSVGREIGRLFFTPTERAQLDQARLQKKPPPVAVADAPPPAPTAQIVSYSGIVRRSDGRALLWLNNRLVDEKEALTSLNLEGKVRRDGAVTLRVPDSGDSVEVKVGQSVELQSGRVAETRKPARNAEAETPAAAEAPAKQANAAEPTAQAPAPAAAEKSAAASAGVGLRLDLGGGKFSPPASAATAATAAATRQ